MILITFLQAGNIFKLLQVLVLSGIKFIFAPPLSIGFGFNWIQTILVTTIGGILGVIFFFFLSEMIILFLKKMFPIVKFLLKRAISIIRNKPFEIPQIKIAVPSTKKIFTRKNKLIVKTKNNFGLWGIAALTPVLLSIPIGTFLANKYYKNKRKVIFSLSVSIACWSLIASSIYFIF
jgi:hypothetical protein